MTPTPEELEAIASRINDDDDMRVVLAAAAALREKPTPVKLETGLSDDFTLADSRPVHVCWQLGGIWYGTTVKPPLLNIIVNEKDRRYFVNGETPYLAVEDTEGGRIDIACAHLRAAATGGDLLEHLADE